MLKKNGIIYFVIFTFIVLMSILTIPITVYIINNFIKSGDNDWIGYLGNIVGGVLGGAFTLLGVRFAFNLEKKKAYIEGLPEKIITLDKIKLKVNGHEFDKLNNSILENLQKSDEKKIIASLENTIDSTNKKISDILKEKQSLLEDSSKIDIDVYVSSTKYISCMEIMEYQLEVLKADFINKKKNNKTIALNLNEMYIFHAEIRRILIELIKSKNEYYTQKLYDQKYPRKIIEQYNSKEYIRKIMDKLN